MANWVSKGGVFFPAKERVALKNNSNKAIKNPSEKESKYHEEIVQPGEDYIYEGPCRQALFELFKENVETFGTDFRYDPEVVSRVRQVYNMTMEEYLKFVGYDEEKEEKLFKEKASVVSKHDLPKKVKALEIMGGGKDFSGAGGDVKGGFGMAPGM